ncbi:MAG: hypothetical protein U0105_06355 [Candidatus Obscuribacterales bacterium]
MKTSSLVGVPVHEASPPILLIEINEVSRDLLAQASRQAALPNIMRILGFDESHTFTEDKYDSGYLEPWVQWVSVHTGKPSSQHKIMHLGDVPAPSIKQIWETLSDAGVHSGVWGIMNGARRGAQNCDFFVADPWTFVEDPYPDSLLGMISFARYLAKNYLNLSPLEMVRQSLIYLGALLQNVSIPELFAATGILLDGILRFGPKHHVLGAFFEYLSVVAFIRYRQRYNPQFSVVFLNLIAHLQHRYWLSNDELSPELVYGFKVIDQAVGKLLQSLNAGETVVVADALSQENTRSEETWILYRPLDPEGFVKAMGIDCDRVEALMTYDAHVFFSDAAQARRAYEIIKAASIAGQPLFFVDQAEPGSSRFFYRVDFNRVVSPDLTFELGGRTYRFFDYFGTVGTRTGKHSQHGFAFQSRRIMPEKILNHQIHDYICAQLISSYAVVPADTAEVAHTPAVSTATSE